MRHCFRLCFVYIIAILVFFQCISVAQDPTSETSPKDDDSIYKEALENPTEPQFFGGDMIITAEVLAQMDPEYIDSAIPDEKYRWLGYPGQGIVPYVIDKSLFPLRRTIFAAMRQFSKKTCIKFRRRRRNETTYINIFKGSGCWSYVGKRDDIPGQQVSLGTGCEPIGTIVHELMHVLGFYHEQNRYDRDDYLNVYTENVIPALIRNFDKLSEESDELLNHFDYNSIMIYGNDAFAKRPGLITMEAKDKSQNLTSPYSKPGLDRSDIERIRLLYKCRMHHRRYL